MKRKYRKPLVVFTPKSLLRHPSCISDINDFSSGSFQSIIDDIVSPDLIEKLVLCSGKIFYDLLARREKEPLKNVALVRVEQLFPLHKHAIESVIKKYDAKQIIWVQEEPENMGAWTFILAELHNFDIQIIARKASAATATGSSKKSALQQQKIIDKVFKN